MPPVMMIASDPQKQFTEYLSSLFPPSTSEFYSYDRSSGQRQYRSRIKQLLENYTSRFIAASRSRGHHGHIGKKGKEGLTLFGYKAESVIVDSKHFPVGPPSRSWFPPRIEEIVDVDGVTGNTVLRVTYSGLNGSEVSLTGRSDELIYLSSRTGANIPYAIHRNKKTLEGAVVAVIGAQQQQQSTHNYLDYIRKHLRYAWIPVRDLFGAYRSMQLRVELMPLAGLQRTRLHLFTAKDRIANMQQPPPRKSSIKLDAKYTKTPPASAYTCDNFAHHAVSRIQSVVDRIHQVTSTRDDGQQQVWTYVLLMNIPFAPFLAASTRLLRESYPAAAGATIGLRVAVLDLDSTPPQDDPGKLLVNKLNDILREADNNFVQKRRQTQRLYTCDVHVALVNHASALVSDTNDSAAIGNSALKCDMIVYLDLSADVDRILDAYRVATPTADVYTYLNLAHKCKALRVPFDSTKIVNKGRLHVSPESSSNSHHIPGLNDEEVFGSICQCRRVVLKPDYTLDTLSKVLCILGTDLSELVQEDKKNKRNSIESHYSRISSRFRAHTNNSSISIQAECRKTYEEEKTLIAHLFRTITVTQEISDAAKESARYYYNLALKMTLNQEDLKAGKKNIWLIQLLRQLTTPPGAVCTSIGKVYRILSNSVGLFSTDKRRVKNNNDIRFKRSGWVTKTKNNNKSYELFTRVDKRIPVILTEYSKDALDIMLSKKKI